MSESKKLMILGGSILQLPAIKTAKAMGLQVIVVDRDPLAIGFKEPGVIPEIISTIDTENVVKAAKKHQINGIMTLASDLPMQTVAVVVKELGLNGISKETAIKATNKIAMRLALQDYQVPIPLFFIIKNKADYDNAIKNLKSLGKKCIIKPADNSGSRGIILIDDFNNQSLIEHAYSYSQQYSRSGDLLVEEYMEGDEISVETLSMNGVCHIIQITDKLTTGQPYFVEMGHSQPTKLSQDLQDRVKQVVNQATRAIGITEGPSHVEIKITSEGPKVVELGARLGGDNITTHLVPLSTGIDMVKNCIHIAMGDGISIQPLRSCGSAIRYLKEDHGTISDITGIEKAKKLKGIVNISIVHSIGDHLHGIQSSNDRVGFVIAQADTAQEAIHRCEAALELIKVKVDHDV